ncbi:MAG: acyl-CoA thioesterase [Planctomycetaceae bacterium]|nr:acyl-CoA thioesterase [Planctomycetaceae bacterium]
MSDWYDVEIRVRYCETDAMGFLHHSHYISFFEIARTELFRAIGGNYRALEDRGFFLVVVKVECQYKRPARYDDLLQVRARVVRNSGAKLEHEYEVRREGELVATGKTILACVDRSGTVQRITDDLLFGEPSLQPETPSDK